MDSAQGQALATHERRVLVVDDDATIRLAIAELLETEGYVVDTARDGVEALQCMGLHRPAVAVVDLMMPVLDGWSLLRTCRADPTLADLPVIVMSARPDAPQSVAEFGAEACLVKPFDVDLLLAALEQAFRTVPQCAVCASSGAAHELPVFVPDERGAVWRLCGQCWNLLELGFVRLRHGASLDAYLERPGFHITDAEVRTYIRLGLTTASM
ncbi:MAG: response regulator transcription factor [Chloroflexi bacterium]|nr:response regulator transcription factor [Chloroflexota bacterium]